MEFGSHASLLSYYVQVQTGSSIIVSGDVEGAGIRKPPGVKHMISAKVPDDSFPPTLTTSTSYFVSRVRVFK